MRTKRTDWRGRCRRWLQSWQAPTVVAVLLLLALVWWALPRRIERVAMSEAEPGSSISEATPQHEVIWDTSHLQALSRIWWRALLLTVLLAGVPAAGRYGTAWISKNGRIKKSRIWEGEALAAPQASFDIASPSGSAGASPSQTQHVTTYPPLDPLAEALAPPLQSPSGMAPTARFMAASLCLHCAILMLMMFMPLAKVVIALAKEIHVGNPAVQMQDDNQHQSHEPGLEAYEKLSDLAALEAQPVPEVQRQAVEPVNIPERSESPILNLPRHVSRNISPDRIEFVPVPAPLVEQPAARRPLELARPMPRPIEVARLEMDASLPTVKEELPAEQQLKPSTPQVNRQQMAETQLPELKATLGANDLPPPRRMVKLPDAVVEEIAELPATPTPPLPREAARPALPPLVQQVAASPLPAATVTPLETQVAGRVAPLIRMPPVLPAPSLETRPELGGPHKRLETRLIVGTLASKPLDAPPSLNPLASQLNRPKAQSKPVAMAVDNVGLEAMFTLRQGEARREFIELFGGNPASEAAVNKGLEWLAAHQNPDGSWTLQKHEGSATSDTAATGFALLPFLAAGHTPKEGQYQTVVAKGVAWLVATQKPNGDLLAPKDDPHHQMYSHGVAAIALCEVYGMTQLPELRDPAQRALDFIAASQHAGSGGWRYRPNESGDTSVVGWQVMALKSGEMAGLKVSPQALDGVKRWLASVESNQPAGGRFGYTDRGANPTMTAEGLLCVQFLGASRNSPRMRAGADFLMKNPPTSGRETSYYWYYGTQVMYHMQGEYWAAWNERMRDLLVNTQVKDGANAGTWNPTDQWEKSGGRVYSTSIKLLMLEVYYRHLPLYQQLDAS